MDGCPVQFEWTARWNEVTPRHARLVPFPVKKKQKVRNASKFVNSFVDDVSHVHVSEKKSMTREQSKPTISSSSLRHRWSCIIYKLLQKPQMFCKVMSHNLRGLRHEATTEFGHCFMTEPWVLAASRIRLCNRQLLDHRVDGSCSVVATC